MSTYSVRCRNSACRHRRVSCTHPDDYARVPKCPACGHRKGWRIEGRDWCKRNRCHCAGYHHPHAANSKMCDPVNQARRAGATDDDLPLEYMGRTCTSAEAPF